MAQTGDVCTEAGVYETDCDHALTRRFQVGEIFPSCTACGRAVSWLLAAHGLAAGDRRACCPVRRDPETGRGEPRDGGDDPCC